MELRETIESINYKLEKEFGKHIDGRPNFRVVWSEDQYEKRWTSFTDEGFELPQRIVKELPKYKQYVHEKFILERLLPVIGESDLIEKTSYEPAWVFQDKDGIYLPPFFDGCKFVVEAILEQMGHKGHVKYKDPNVSEEERLIHLNEVEKELFGNETSVGDALAHGYGVGFTTSKLLN